MNLHIGIDGASARNQSMSSFNDCSTLYLSPAEVTLIGRFLSAPTFGGCWSSAIMPILAMEARVEIHSAGALKS
jgi:hypothetical protein